MRITTLAILLTLFTVPAFIQAQAGPVISFDSETHDYGKVKYGDTVTHKFIVTNTGDQTLTISKLGSSCGCTRAVKGASTIPPNGKTEIVASFNTTGFRAGKKQKRVFVHSNDPKRPMVTLTITADIVKDLSLDRPSLAKKLTEAVDTLSFPEKITNSSDKEVTITGVTAQAASLKASLNPEKVVVKPHSTEPFTLVLKLKNGPNQFFWMGRIILATNHPREKKVELRYLIQLKPE